MTGTKTAASRRRSLYGKTTTLMTCAHAGYIAADAGVTPPPVAVSHDGTMILPAAILTTSASVWPLSRNHTETNCLLNLKPSPPVRQAPGRKSAETADRDDEHAVFSAIGVASKSTFSSRQSAKYRDFNRQLVGISTGNLLSFQPATCGVFNRQLVEFLTGNLSGFQPATC